MLTVAYDGTNYHGWQVQPNGQTIEGILNECLSELLGEKIEVTGASRTDSGVHAMGNVAVFDTDSPIPADRISYALNRRLPEDIRIQKSQEVDPGFHPRHCDSCKTYEYRIYCAPFPMPVKRLYAHFTYVPMDVALMSQAARYLEGRHDFKSFCSAGAQVETTVRQVDRVEVWEEGGFITQRGNGHGGECGIEDTDRNKENAGLELGTGDMQDGREIVIRVTGRGFLYNMVRIIAGTLMEVGRGHLAPQEMERILAACDRQAAGPTAPACGLTLVRIVYFKDTGDDTTPVKCETGLKSD